MIYAKNQKTTEYLYNRAITEYSQAKTFDQKYKIIRRLKMLSTSNRTLMVLANKLAMHSENSN
jgi:hypothetical protein